MSGYIEAAKNFNAGRKQFDVENTFISTLLTDDQKAEEIERINKQYEANLKEEMAIANVLENEGADFFKKSPSAQEKMLKEHLLREGILQQKTYEDGSGSYIAYADGEHHYPPATDAYELSTRAQNMVVGEAVRMVENIEKDPLNMDGKSKTREFKQEYYGPSSISDKAMLACKFIEKNDSRTFSKDSLDLSVITSKETQGKSVVGEEEFKGLLAERVKDLGKIKEFENNPNQRYYGDGLMVQKDPSTQAITYSLYGQQIDKNTSTKLLQLREFANHNHNGLTAGVQYGSLICVYNPDSKDASGKYSEMKWLTSDGNEGLKEVSKETAQQIRDADIKSGKDVGGKKVKVENYGGGLMHLKDQNGKSTYVNANNFVHSNTGNSYNMLRMQAIAQIKEGGR